MKTTLTLGLATLFCASVHAQVFRPETLSGAILGGVAGAVIGNNSHTLHHNGARGAAFGAVTGALIGTAIGRDREERGERDIRPGGYYSSSPTRSTSLDVSVGYGPRYWGGSRHRVAYAYPYRDRDYGFYPSHDYREDYCAPVYSTYPYDYDYGHSYGGTTYEYARPSRAVSGALLGGIAGAIIGNNTRSRNTWGGAAIGAGAGLLLGALTDRNNRDEQAPVPVYRSEPQVSSRQSANTSSGTLSSVPTQNATVINNYYGSSGSAMSAANGMFGR